MRNQNALETWPGIAVPDGDIEAVRSQIDEIGPVPGVTELVEELGLTILSRHPLPVRLHLLAVRDSNLAAIKRIISHPMALAQCSQWLGLAGKKTEEAENTASAAKYLSQNGDPACAVIASDRAARIYGLRVLAQNIHDRADNETLFAVVAMSGAAR